ncbi:HNH endonuclease [Anabaena cylindrica FACHB-243]|uniref:HNH endonuclease n=1 Tax=Anabaena cylindrica (strain ATCC 27899 / PCC 7122) TaxID=272123 RepID=K9ZNE2_ANACC|nr:MULTISPECIES: HNH endonuclease [Anabaena]AFZ60706.1 HNH endonuclease [Anabaena cylindrica PCC 7122]MBD2419513.1 HNH endonuclease [Anabaena cylindrica FACHB-243]MBY5282229.1 HNH endonuclease [Anabaena sp. CCAP 1446/1C]MBY5311480.1 HNH endonuclease [Anabaena sp. CCAP 1446/1C]MCM2409707.1 HNH endonuclease [Anabaena sp. CCAP 1446/1C]
MTVNDATRKLVRERAKFLCEYCHSLEEASAALFAIDHIIPQSISGSSDDPDNLALACQRCNGYRYNFTTGIDPETKEIIPIFNPRKQKWSDHFIWSLDSLKIIGITPTERATCNRLDLNDERHNEGSIIKARRFWVKGGWHPPYEDPRQKEED